MSMTYYAVTDDPNELAHYGILGMKWGVVHDKPRHSGSRRPRSAAYKKAQSKLGKMMRSGIKKAEAQWKAYNSPKAKEARFMKKAMQQARTGTLKYGKLTDDQVRRVTERLALERNARQLGSTENPTYAKRLKAAIGEGIIRGIGAGTASYIDERFRGRGRTTAEIKADKRMDKYNSKESTQARKRERKLAEEYYNTVAEEGDRPRYHGNKARARYLKEVKERNKKNEYAANIQKIYDEQQARISAANDAKRMDEDKRSARANAKKLESTTIRFKDPATGKTGKMTTVQALEAWNKSHEEMNRIGNSYYDSMNTSLAKIKADEARAREAAKRDKAFNEAMRSKQRADAERESARAKREAERTARLESVTSAPPTPPKRPKRPGGPVHDWEVEPRRYGETTEEYARRVADMRNKSRNRRKSGGRH